MKRSLLIDEFYDELSSFDVYRERFISPFKPRAPTPPKSKEGSPKNVNIHQYLKNRTSSVDFGVFVLKVPFDSVDLINKQTLNESRCRKKLRFRRCSVNRYRNSSLERFY
jgi:hypothetical protein